VTSPIASALRQCAAAIIACADVIDSQAIASDVVSVAEAATIAKCSARSVRAAIKAGRVTARGRGRHVVIARSDLDAWLAALPPRPARIERDAADVDEDETDALVDELLGAVE
jgi:excisionase family DNA binding protein